jgi:hypothetical protein
MTDRQVLEIDRLLFPKDSSTGDKIYRLISLGTSYNSEDNELSNL